ncbi:glycosyltransferase [Planctomicrobium sp. SH661]|uniref:glycosyltransferase n=1 Tax=Planctomicrobium sp. SH661 TaxID=3448124 RepID=UPI003F5BD130
MEIASVLYIALAAALVLVNFVWHARFQKMLRTQKPRKSVSASSPRALVVLTLRGADPFLERTLAKLAQQSYQNFALRIIIDSERDLAWTAVNQFLRLEHRPQTDVQILNRRLETCSLKASALLQAMSHLDCEYHAVAQIDADAVPYSEWLQDMLSPLEDPQVGVVSGLRWYVPSNCNWATRLRQIWGSSAMVQMFACGMAWGGSMAVSRKFLESSDLLDRWTRCLAEDMTVNDALKSTGSRLEFVPAVLSNHEETSLPSCFEFIRRQIFQARWQNPNWWLVSANTWLLILSSAIGATSIAMAAVQGDSPWLATLVGMLAIYVLIYLYSLNTTESLIRKRLHEQGETADRVGAWLAIGLGPTALLFIVCYLSACLIRRVTWRGVDYEVRGVNQFRMLRDSARSPVAETDLLKSRVPGGFAS